MKNGFTLVELLAVIVILAVLALIATPVVLSIIDDAKESAMLRSAEMYLSGVENAVMRENMNSGGNFRPNECIITNGNMTCGSTNVEVEVDGEVPYAGSITFENGKITSVTLNYESGTIVKDSSGNLAFETKFEDICTLVSGTEKTAGAKYTCEVKEGTSYNFYVLTTPKEGDTTINLIMDRNICEDGTLATAENKCLVAWMSYSNYGCEGFGCAKNDRGPVTAMNFLYNATKDWENIPNIEMNYMDEGNTGSYGYGTIKTTNNITKITKKDGTLVMVLNDKEGYENLKARMPYYLEIQGNDSNKIYLYDNLIFGCYSSFAQTNLVECTDWGEVAQVYDKGLTQIDGIHGYWSLSSSNRSNNTQLVFGGAHPSWDNGVGEGTIFGVRPVITLKI